MLRALLAIFFLLPTIIEATEVNAAYQVDLIIFTQSHPTLTSTEHNLLPLELPSPNQSTITLKPQDNSSDFYRLLPRRASYLLTADKRLRQQQNYRIIAHYSWRQPLAHPQTIKLPDTEQDQWRVSGTLTIGYNSYYRMNGLLSFYAPGAETPSFAWPIKKRLKKSLIYYIDHPQAGLLVDIHPLA